MTSFVLALVAPLLLGSMANAAGELNCKNVDPEAIIRSVGLSEDGKELRQSSSSTPPTTRMLVKELLKASDVSGETILTYKGSVIQVADAACAGGCPSSTFEFVTTASKISPNSTLIITSTGLNEASGQPATKKFASKYDCTSKAESTNTIDLKPTVSEQK